MMCTMFEMGVSEMKFLFFELGRLMCSRNHLCSCLNKNSVFVHRISDARLHVSILTHAISLIVVNDFNSIILPKSDT